MITNGISVTYTGPAEPGRLALGDTGRVLDTDYLNRTATVLWESGGSRGQVLPVQDYDLAPGDSLGHTAAVDSDLLTDSLEVEASLSVRAAYDDGGAEATVDALYQIGGAQVVAARMQQAVEGAIAELRADHSVKQALHGLDEQEIDDVVRHASLSALAMYVEEESDDDE